MSASVTRFCQLAFLALLIALAASTLPTPTPAHADAFVVNSTGDGVDVNHGDGVCETATSGECTLRAAIEEAAHTIPPDTITFSTSGTIIPATDLPVIAGMIDIDGTSAPGYQGTPVITIDGSAIPPDSVRGLVRIEANGCTMEGLRLQNFVNAGVSIFNGDGNHVEDNELLGNGIGVAISGYSSQNIVSGNLISGNLHGGVVSTGPDSQTGNRIEGNTISNNQSPDPDDASGIRLAVGPLASITAAEIRDNTITGNEGDAISLSASIHSGLTGTIVDGNTISGNGAGIMLDDNGSPDGSFSGTEITNNTLADTGGIEVVGTQDFDLTNLVLSGNNISGAEHDGIYLLAAGAADADGFAIDGNTITDCGWYGIQIVGDLDASTSGTITGNTIMDNTAAGIMVMWWASDITIGPDNVIARNGTLPMPTGIVIANFASSITVTRNSIYDNDGLGIDLGLEDGVTENDDGDADTGPNGLLNFPVITSAMLSSVEVTTCGNCTVEVFLADDDGDNGGHGEGRTFLGSYQTGGPTSHWTVPIEGAVECRSVTATVTDHVGNTSEFSANVALPCPPSHRSPRTATPTATPIVTVLPTASSTPLPPPAATATPSGGAGPVVQPPATGTGGSGSSWPLAAWLLAGVGVAATVLGALRLRASGR
jgi:CSLREA domain-containing protein